MFSVPMVLVNIEGGALVMWLIKYCYLLTLSLPIPLCAVLL